MDHARLKHLMPVLEQMDGTEVGSMQQIRWMLKLAGVEWEEDAEAVYVQSPTPGNHSLAAVGVVRTRSRKAILRYARKHGAVLLLPEEGERFATLSEVVRVVLAVTVGDPVQGASPPEVWKEQHSQRMEYLKKEVEKTHATTG